MDKFKLITLGMILSAPLFLIAGYKWGENSTAVTFIELTNLRNAADTKIFTKMAVLFHDQELDRLSKFISVMAHNSHRSMVAAPLQLGMQVDIEANEYFISHKSKLVPPAQ